jgi:hypothetical protein
MKTKDPLHVDLRDALKRCEEARRRMAVEALVFEPWMALLEALAKIELSRESQ